jgi:hypothetical protein
MKRLALLTLTLALTACAGHPGSSAIPQLAAANAIGHAAYGSIHVPISAETLDARSGELRAWPYYLQLATKGTTLPYGPNCHAIASTVKNGNPITPDSNTIIAGKLGITRKDGCFDGGFAAEQKGSNGRFVFSVGNCTAYVGESIWHDLGHGLARMRVYSGGLPTPNNNACNVFINGPHGGYKQAVQVLVQVVKGLSR